MSEQQPLISTEQGQSHRFSNAKDLRDSIKAGVEAASEAPSPASGPNLAQKILAIQATVGAVKKKGKFDTSMGSANFLRIEDTVMAVSKLMTQHGLIITGTLARKTDGAFCYERVPHTTKGWIASVIMEWTIEDTLTGETRSWCIPGEGYDPTDKGTPKAQTSSRKYAIIEIFNLAIGNDIEGGNTATFEEGKERQAKAAQNKIADAAGRGVKSAVEQYSQIEPEKKLVVARPEQFNGHYIIATGFISVPQLAQFFEDTSSKYLDASKTRTGKSGWKVSAEYEKGLIALCEKLNIEVEG